MKTFLGTNFGHSAAVALISEAGTILGAVEEGRIIGDKDTAKFPLASLQWLISEFDPQVAAWHEGWIPHRRLLLKGSRDALRYGLRDHSYLTDRFPRELRRFLCGQFQFRSWRGLAPGAFVGHHLAHAYSLLPAGLPPHSVILVSDTIAEEESISVFFWTGQHMHRLRRSLYPHSIGHAFHRFAHHVGFRGRTAPGTLMALASYGEPRWLPQLRRLVEVSDATVRFDLKRLPIWHRTTAWLQLAERIDDSEFAAALIRSRGAPQAALDLAASVQCWFTEMTLQCIVDSIRIATEEFGGRVQSVGLAGGAALNCKANSIFLEACLSSGIELVISPWSDDAGTAIGAAISAVLQERPRTHIPVAEPFLGPSASNVRVRVEEEHLTPAIDLLCQGGSVALISGRLEFGPRALGGRCILGDARDTKSRYRLNNIKGRPAFMPFAPAILAGDLDSFFDSPGSPWMTWTVRAKELARHTIPAAVHCDGSARVQVVRECDSKVLLSLLRAFKARTGVGVLLLTSLNGNGEAIPADLQTAIACARRLGLRGAITDQGWEELPGSS